MNNNFELSLNDLDAVTGGDNFKAYGEVHVLGMTVAVAETKQGLVEGQVYGSSGKSLGPVQYGT
jgi:hypothetical protein